MMLLIRFKDGSEREVCEFEAVKQGEFIVPTTGSLDLWQTVAAALTVESKSIRERVVREVVDEMFEDETDDEGGRPAPWWEE